MDAGLALALEQLIVYRYWLLLPLAIVEGPMIAFLSGMLVALGYFKVFIALFILVLGDLLPDGFLYMFGRYAKKWAWAERFGNRLRLTPERLASASALWHANPGKAIFISKFAYGVSAPLLFMAGLFHIPARLFFGYSVSISIVHYSIMMALGYFFGAALSTIQDTVTAIEIGIAIAAALSIGYIIMKRRLRKNITSI